MSDELDPFDLPAPTGDQQIAERRYKFVVGIVRHNAPCSITQLRLLYCRRYSHRSFEAVVRTAMDNGHIVRRSPDGFETSKNVR